MKGINELAERAYLCALRREQIQNGFIRHEDTVASLAEEFAEVVLADEYARSEHLPFVSQTAEELTDLLIVCLTELHRRDINVERTLIAKMKFNEQR